MQTENPVWLGEYVWEEMPLDGGPPKAGPLPAEVLSMFRPQHCLLCGITTANMQTAYTHYESKGHFKKVVHHMREKFNALGSLKSNKEKFRMVKCDICNVELTSRIVYLQHYDGKQHLKNLKKRGFKPPVEETPPGDLPAVSDPEASQDATPLLPKLGDYVCALCNVTTATRGQMQVHNNGSRHMKNVAKLADGELRDFYMTNGNCEPMDHDEEGAKDNGVSEQPSGQSRRPKNRQPPGAPQDQQYNSSGYGPPMDPSVMQQYPQMPYGAYPQYPMPYDYSSWGQNMYGGYSGSQPYNGQYGPGPYGSYPPYGYQGPDYYNQQQYHQGYNQGQYNQGQYNQGQYNPDQQYDSNSQSWPGKDQPPNPSPKDPRRRSREIKESEVNETPLPDGVKVKPLAVFPFISRIDSSDDRPPGVDAPPGVDRLEDEFSKPLLENTSLKSEKDKSAVENDEVVSKPKAESPPKTLLDMIREENRKAKLAREEEEKAKASSPAPDSADLPPIPGLDSAPIETKSPIITWTEGKDCEIPGEEPPMLNDIAPGEVVPPPPHPLNPPLDFLPPSPDPDAPVSIKPPSQPEPSAEPQVTSSNSSLSFSEPQTSGVSPTQFTQVSLVDSSSYTQVSSVDSTPYTQVSSVDSTVYTQVSSANSSLSQTPVPLGNLQPHYSHPPVRSTPQVLAYSQPTMHHSYQASPQVNQMHNYNAPFISTPPVSYPQGAPTSYSSMYQQVNTGMYPQAPVVPQVPVVPQAPAALQTPAAPQAPAAPLPTAPQPTPSLVTVKPKAPPIPPLPTIPVNPPTTLATTPEQPADDKSAKDDDPSKPNSKPKINSFFRRAAEKMFKEHKEKKMKEDAKKVEKEPKDEAVNKSKDVSKEIVIVTPSSGPRSGEPATDTTVPKVDVIVTPSSGPRSGEPATDTTVPKVDSVSETEVGSEPGEIVDKKPVPVKTVENNEPSGQKSQNSFEAETAESEKKFDFGSRRGSDNRRKRSFRARRASASRSRSRSRSPKRRNRRRSRSWSPSPEKSPVGYYQRNTFQSYYGNDTSYWRNDKAQFRSYEDWNKDRSDRYDRRRNERDEFGREKKWKEEKRKEERKKKKRKSRRRSRSVSESPNRKNEPKEPEQKKRSPSPPKPVLPKAEPGSVEPKPVGAPLMQRLKGVLPAADKQLELFPKKEVPAKLVEEVKNTVEVRDVLIRPDVDSDEAREVEKEEQEILKKVALIKKKLLEKDDEKPVKTKKRKKDKAKRRKKRRKSSSSSESESSSSESDSSSSSSSSTSSSSSSTSAGSEPKSKRIVESLLTKLSKQAATGEAAGFDLSMLPALVKKSKKSDSSSKKKKKKDKKRKKKKKEKKKAPEPPLQVLSAFITPDGAYHCKCCNLTTNSGSSFLEHLISEKHKLLVKLMSTTK